MGRVKSLFSAFRKRKPVLAWAKARAVVARAVGPAAVPQRVALVGDVYLRLRSVQAIAICTQHHSVTTGIRGSVKKDRK